MFRGKTIVLLILILIFIFYYYDDFMIHKIFTIVAQRFLLHKSKLHEETERSSLRSFLRRASRRIFFNQNCTTGLYKHPVLFKKEIPNHTK